MTAPNEDDRLVWNGENKGDFDLKSAYNLAIGSMDGGDKFTGRWIWKSETLLRIKTFLWQCMHYNIGVGECLVRRCLSESDICPMCNRESETILHRLRDCSFSRDTQFKLGINPSSNFYEGNLQYWLETNCKDGFHKVGINLLGRLSFPFPSGAFGRTETILCFGTGLLNQTYTTTLSLEPQNFSIAFVKQSAWIARSW